jgi:hypothetical protein
VTYTDFHVEIQPVFEQEDGSFKYPDTKGLGSWPITKPRSEMNEVADMDNKKNSNLRRLCKMTRAWRNKHGIEMGGLLIDTLAYNFLKSTKDYDAKSYGSYDLMSRDFFAFLSELPEQDYYAAPGSGQRVKVRKKFQRRAKKANKLCVEAIEAAETKGANDKWKKVYGRPFPANKDAVTESLAANTTRTWNNTEQFIENQYPIDIRHTLKIECEVKQNGFRENLLSHMLLRHIPLLLNKNLRFSITRITVPKPYSIEWKVLNRGEIAERKNCIRGQIVSDGGNEEKTESTNFRGDHVVECYAIKDGVVVAKDRILVPISSNS